MTKEMLLDIISCVILFERWTFIPVELCLVTLFYQIFVYLSTHFINFVRYLLQHQRRIGKTPILLLLFQSNCVIIIHNTGCHTG